MWFPEVRLEEPESKDHPIPEFVQPVYSASSGELTHYIVMYGAITWLSETKPDGNQDLDIYCCITVVPAEIAILTSLRYELAEALDALRPTRISTCNSHDEMPSGWVLLSHVPPMTCLMLLFMDTYRLDTWRIMFAVSCTVVFVDEAD